MKRALILSLCILAGSQVPIAEAEPPPPCEGEYRGSYNGDFSGVAGGNFSVNDQFGCDPTSLGSGSVYFYGSLPQFFFSGDVTRTEVSADFCVLGDLSFEGSSFAGSVPEGFIREFIVSGTMNLVTCTMTGSWTLEHIDLATNITTTLGSGGFTMSFEPSARGRIRWTALNGDFSNNLNWDPQQVPSGGLDAVFDRNQVYAVSFASAPSSGGFIVDQGFPTFLTGSYSATGGSELFPSAIVGSSNLNTAQLILSNHHLTTAFSTIGLSPDSDAEVSVEDGSTWTEQTRMVIGRAGKAILSIHDLSVTSMETQIGVEAGSDGTVFVDEPILFSQGAAAQWTTGSIAIGAFGKGAVTQEGGSIQSHTVSVGVEAGSEGTVKVGSAGNTAVWEFDGAMTVGERGEGQFDIVEGGFVISTANGIILVGQFHGGSGTLRVDGTGSELSAPDSNLGLGVDGGTGLMTLTNGGKVKCDIALIGNGGPGRLLISDSKFTCSQFIVAATGTVVLNNGILDVANFLDFQTGATLGGRGMIVAPNAQVVSAVMPGRVNLPLPPPPKGLPNPDEPIGTLTFGGNVDFGSATLEIEVGGLAEGNFDVIHATGAVDIQNSTVVFTFIDGFLPQTGDTVPFLIADGGMTAANLALEFEGVADGFQFEVTEESGMLVFEALSDAQPLPIPSADLNKDGGIDFIDLLIFIQQMNSAK